MLPSLILSSLLVCACGASLSAETRPFDVAPTAHCLTIDDTNQTIELTADELNNHTFTNLANYLNENYESLSSPMFSTHVNQNNNMWECDDFVLNDSLCYGPIETNYLTLRLEPSTEEYGHWYLEGDTDAPVTSEYPFVFDFSAFLSEPYEGIISAIEADLNPSSTPSGAEVVTDIVSILVSGLTTLGTGIGSGVANFAQALAFDGDGLSVYFVLVLAFAGVSLAVGLTTKIFDWLSSLGN